MRLEGSATSISWIPSEAVKGVMELPFSMGVAHYDDPPPDALDGAPVPEVLEGLRAADRFRFANHLEGWIEVEDGRITGHGQGGEPVIGGTTIRAGRSITVAAVPFEPIRHEPEVGDGWVRFRQSAGGRTGVPAPRHVNRPPFVQVVAPTAWSTLALTLHADGRQEIELEGASPFPRHWVYDHEGRLVRKSGMIDFKDWYRHAFGAHSPWGEEDSPAIATEVETALERELSLAIMRDGRRPRVRKVSDGGALTRQGEAGDELYLLLDGVLGVEVDGERLAELGPGAVLGERALLEGGLRTATLTALTTCKVAVARADELDPAALAELRETHRRPHPAPTTRSTPSSPDSPAGASPSRPPPRAGPSTCRHPSRYRTRLRRNGRTVGCVLTGFDTHEVTNQPPPLEGHDVFTSDVALVNAVARSGAGWALDDLTALGRLAGSAAAIEWGRQANRNPPELRTHDRYGNRLDVVDYHPAYHQLMRTAVANGLHAAPWADERGGAHVARAAKVLVWYQVDGGHVCPISMTYSAVPALRHEPRLADEWEPRLTSLEYDPANRPAAEKAGATCGMAMTEKQGGSDVRANTTTATPDGDGAYRLTGHKWFCSAPMSDAFLVLAQAPGGLTCFLVPRWRPDGSRNPIRIQRLKDKLGDRSNASSEIELLDTFGERIGDEGRGVRTIIEMVNHTRLDCVLGATAIHRQGVAQATWHAHHRSAFGTTLDRQALMANVLADLALESEAATLSAIRLARAFDAAAGDEHEQLVQRLLTPVVKYWTCKRAPQHTAEALECLGGAGYVEESDLPRLFRQSPLNGVWEGSGNVICLDVLRAVGRAPETLDAYWVEVEAAAGGDRRFDAAADALREELADVGDIEGRARRLVEQMALLFQASLVLQHSPAPVADAFVASRLTDDAGRAFGTLPTGLALDEVVERARPAG